MLRVTTISDAQPVVETLHTIHKSEGTLFIAMPNAITYDVTVIINEVIFAPDSHNDLPRRSVEFSANIPLHWAMCLDAQDDTFIRFVLNDRFLIEIATAELVALDWSENGAGFMRALLHFDDELTDASWSMEFLKRGKYFCLDRIVFNEFISTTE